MTVNRTSSTTRVFGRLVLYTALVVLSAQMIRWDTGILVEGRKFVETSFTEFTQEAYILLTALIFLFIGKRFESLRPIAYFGGGGFLVVLVREMDAYLDAIYHGAWFPFALLILAATLYSSYRNRHKFVESLNLLMSTPAFGFLVAGGLCVFVFARLFGAKSTWIAVFAVDVLEPNSPGRWVKNAVEEGSELFGYTLILCASIELWSYARRTLKASGKQ